jgi:hypothetical protein
MDIFIGKDLMKLAGSSMWWRRTPPPGEGIIWSGRASGGRDPVNAGQEAPRAAAKGRDAGNTALVDRLR